MKKILWAIGLNAFLFVLFACGMVMVNRGQRPEVQDQPFPVYNTIVMNKINETRETAGLKSLVESATLVESSKLKAEQIERTCKFAHDIESNNDWVETFTQARVKSSTRGEILARWFKTPEGAVNGWIKSPTHYEIMVGKEYKHLGIYTWESKCDNKIYVVGHFSD